MNDNKNIAVLGGGVAGLAAALHLAEKGKKVILIESSNQLGGAASSIDIPQNRKIPTGYHQIVGSDKELLRMLEKLNLASKVKWKNTRIEISADGKNIDLGSVADMLLYRRLSLLSRIKYILFGARCLITKNWSSWENKSVSKFIESWTNREILNEIFKPLVDIKFGFSTDKADAAWLGRRLSHREGNTPFGYIPNTSWTFELCQELSKRIRKLGGIILKSTSVKKINFKDKNTIESIITDKNRKIFVKALLSTLPPPSMVTILEASSHPPLLWIKEFKKIKYISCYSSLLGLPSVPFPEYWTIALQPRRIFGACFTISHLNETLITNKDKSVINLFTNVPFGKYPWTKDEYSNLIVKDLSNMVGKKITPNWIKTNIIKYVSPVFSVGYKSPPEKFGSNLFLAGIYMTYPNFSSTGEAMASGINTAENLLKLF